MKSDRQITFFLVKLYKKVFKMYSYILGKVVEVNSSYIVIDNNGIGYLIYTPLLLWEV